MISESTPVFLNTPAVGNMDETIEFDLETISSMPVEQAAFPTLSVDDMANPGKEDSQVNTEEIEVVEQMSAIDSEGPAKDTGNSLDEVDGFPINPLDHQGSELARPEPNTELDKLDQNKDTPETFLQDSTEANNDNEGSLSQLQAPVDVTSPSAGTKMKFQVVQNNGRMTLRVTRDDELSPQGRKSMVTTPTTPKSRSKTRRSSEAGIPQKATKAPTEKSTGGKTRNKVMSPRSSAVDAKSLAASPNKPLMDLRHILKKYEKKKEPVPQQQTYEVGFYGSLSAIPFLTMNNDKASEKSPKVKGRKKDNGSSHDSNTAEDETTVGTASLNASEDELIPEKPRLPTREEIVVTAEYDEEQLKLWKSMAALDSSLSRIERPQEMLPLRPGVRSEKKMASPRNSGVRAFSRPDDWLGHPEWNASQKSYRSISSDEQPDDDVLVMEPDN